MVTARPPVSSGARFCRSGKLERDHADYSFGRVSRRRSTTRFFRPACKGDSTMVFGGVWHAAKIESASRAATPTVRLTIKNHHYRQHCLG